MEKNKFRIWIKDSQGWVTQGGNIAEITLFNTITNWQVEDNVIIQQFTGVRDKKGKDIYEGDIVEYTIKRNEHGDSEDHIDEIVFEDGAFKIKNEDCFWNLAVACGFSLKVIGNICENPNFKRK